MWGELMMKACSSLPHLSLNPAEREDVRAQQVARSLPQLLFFVFFHHQAVGCSAEVGRGVCMLLMGRVHLMVPGAVQHEAENLHCSLLNLLNYLKLMHFLQILTNLLI